MQSVPNNLEQSNEVATINFYFGIQGMHSFITGIRQNVLQELIPKTAAGLDLVLPNIPMAISKLRA